MKLGLMSDVHANAENLRRALALLQRLGADAILCAGDLVDGETEGNAAVEFARKQGIVCVQGNHDHAMSQYSHAVYAEWAKNWDEASFGPPPWQYSEDAVSDDSREFLRGLPVARRFEFAGKRVLLAHASPWDQTTYVYANGRREYFQRIAEEADADVVILGHTHIPMAVETETTWVFNPGSVDGNRAEPYNATCALLEFPPMRYRVFDLETGKPTLYTFAKLGDLGTNMHEAPGG
jgi:predicted phosphodiesterase